MRSKIVAGNWKMNLTFDEAETLVDDLLDRFDEMDEMNCEVILCPPFPYLEMLTDYEFDEQRFNVGAQNCSAYDKGAYTGEVSAKMLKSIDVDYCIVGHSERRKYFGETNEVLAEKVNRLIENNMSPIYCVGEVLEEREAGRHFEVVKEQLEKGLFHLDGDAIYDAIIAYEPVWAIGTGKTATPEQAQETHAFIRSLVKEHYDEATADEIRILYGGSCNAKNATELFSQPDVDGGLIGGASLKADDFVSICLQASQIGEE
ncbi:MAG: triose-phosphate isomerase [Bacteroidales bacterium]|nr:triose-phosphate isomerase [Bacteroidales bacterium]